MSGGADELDLLAGEYVLGTLDPEVAEEVAARATSEPMLATLIADWEKRLAPLAALASPVAPPAALWDRLAAASAPRAMPGRAMPGQAARPGPLARAATSLAFWRGSTAAGFALAAALAAIAFLREPAPRPVAALVPANGMPAAFVAEMRPNGSLRLIPLEPVRVAEGRDLELWALPPGATRPISLGVIPAAGRSVAPAQPPSGGTQLLVSLEPRGGSPTGQPTGPVLYGGTLRATD